jgi:DNA polymerase-3 subunit epsilon
MREIVLDTETTGLDPYQGHRLVEVGCVELINRIPSGQTFHRYLNPERDIPAEAFSVHGLSSEFLKDKPPFAEIAEDFLAFVSDARLVIHNAGFDIGFLNAELERAGHRPLARAISALERAAHRAFIATLGANAIWRDYVDPPDAEKAGNSAQSG